MYLDEAIKAFLQYLGSERNLAPRTVEAYGYDLERLRSYLEGGNEPRRRKLHNIDDYDLKDYLAYLQEDGGLKPTTMCRVISSIRVFFAYLEQEGLIDVSPARRLHNPKKPKKVPIFLTDAEAESVLAYRNDEDPMNVRDRTILLLLIMTGLRVSELTGMDVSDVDFSESTIKVFGKGRKERLVPLNSLSRRALQNWLSSRPPGRDGCRGLFLDRNGDRVTVRMVQYAVRKAVKALGLDPRVSPHKLRHTFATHLYAENTDLRDIQELLGHANIASTSIYTHTNVDKVRAAVDALED